MAVTWCALIMTGLLSAVFRLSAAPPPEDAEEAAPPQPPTAEEQATERGWQQFSQRLNRAIENDQTIIARFDQVMQELEIVKVRATRKHSRQQQHELRGAFKRDETAMLGLAVCPHGEWRPLVGRKPLAPGSASR